MLEVLANKIKITHNAFREIYNLIKYNIDMYCIIGIQFVITMSKITNERVKV